MLPTVAPLRGFNPDDFYFNHWGTLRLKGDAAGSLAAALQKAMAETGIQPLAFAGEGKLGTYICQHAALNTQALQERARAQDARVQRWNTASWSLVGVGAVTMAGALVGIMPAMLGLGFPVAVSINAAFQLSRRPSRDRLNLLNVLQKMSPAERLGVYEAASLLAADTPVQAMWRAVRLEGDAARTMVDALGKITRETALTPFSLAGSATARRSLDTMLGLSAPELKSAIAKESAQVARQGRIGWGAAGGGLLLTAAAMVGLLPPLWGLGLPLAAFLTVSFVGRAEPGRARLALMRGIEAASPAERQAAKAGLQKATNTRKIIQGLMFS